VVWASLAVSAAGAGVAAWRTRGYELEVGIAERLRFFAPWQYLVVQAAGARIVHPLQADVAGFADTYLAALPAADRRDVHALVGFVEHGAPLLVGRFSRFTALSPKARDAVLRAIETSTSGKLRSGFDVLKAVSYMALYRRDDTWSAIDYTGPAVPRGEP
jgi:hypothetical protein